MASDQSPGPIIIPRGYKLKVGEMAVHTLHDMAQTSDRARAALITVLSTQPLSKQFLDWLKPWNSSATTSNLTAGTSALPSAPKTLRKRHRVRRLGRVNGPKQRSRQPARLFLMAFLSNRAASFSSLSIFSIFCLRWSANQFRSKSKSSTHAFRGAARLSPLSRCHLPKRRSDGRGLLGPGEGIRRVPAICRSLPHCIRGSPGNNSSTHTPASERETSA